MMAMANIDELRGDANEYMEATVAYRTMLRKRKEARTEGSTHKPIDSREHLA